MEDKIGWKTTFDERQALMEDDLGWKTNNLGQKTPLNGK